MKSRYLLGAIVAVAMLLGGLLFAMQRQGVTPVTPAPVTPDVAEPSLPSARAPTPARPITPPSPTVAAPAPIAADPAVRREDVPGRIVHDHSGEENHSRRSPLSPQTTFSVRKNLTPAVQACATGRSGQQLTVQATVTVSGGRMVTTEPKITHPTFEDATLDACVAKAVADLAAEAPTDQADAVYKIALPFKLP